MSQNKQHNVEPTNLRFKHLNIGDVFTIVSQPGSMYTKTLPERVNCCTQINNALNHSDNAKVLIDQDERIEKIT